MSNRSNYRALSNVAKKEKTSVSYLNSANAYINTALTDLQSSIDDFYNGGYVMTNGKSFDDGKLSSIARDLKQLVIDINSEISRLKAIISQKETEFLEQ